MSGLKTGNEILDEYFKNLINDEKVSLELRQTLSSLWEEKKLSTPTSLKKALDELRGRISHE